MAKGTGVFIPAYAAQTNKQSADGSRDSSKDREMTTKNNSGNRGSIGRGRSHYSSFRASYQQLPSGQVHAYPGAAKDTFLTAPCLAEQQLGHLCLQQLPSPAPSLCSSSDLDILGAASDASFTSSCSSLLAPSFTSPFAAYAAEDVCPSPCGIARAGAAFAAGPSSTSAAELLLLQQQEAEVDAAIINLITLKQQLASIKQQPSLPAASLTTNNYGINQQQQQCLLGATPYLPVSAAPAASGTWASSLSDDGDVLAALDAAIAQVQLQQLAPEAGYQQADLLQLLAGL